MQSLQALTKNPHVGQDEAVADLRATVHNQLIAAVAQGTQDESERARTLLALLRGLGSFRFRLLRAL